MPKNQCKLSTGITKMNILITGVGGPTPRSFALSIKKIGQKFNNVQFFATDNNPLSIGLYQKDIFEKSFLVPSCTLSKYWDEIEKIVKENNIELAIIQPELEVLEWSKRVLESKLPCAVFLPEYNLAQALVDKSKLNEILFQHGLTPAYYSFNRDELNIDTLFSQLGEEFWVRSSKGTSGLGSLKITGRNSLLNWVQLNSEVKTFLASKLLTGRNLACKLLYWNGELIRSASAERVNYIMSKVSPSGITGNTSFGRFLNDEKIVDISKRAMSLLFEKFNLPAHGFYTVDLKEDENGIPFITEINVRHVAFTQCFAAAGANFAEDILSLMIDDNLFDRKYKMYTFEKDLIFLRDVDTLPILMKESNLLTF